MNIKCLSKILLLVILLLLTLPLVESTSALEQPPTIIIRPDGSLSPASAPIRINGNIYTFTSDIYATIKIQKSNVILDGAGYTLSGTNSGEESVLWFVGSGGNPSSDTTLQYTIGVDLGKDAEGIVVKNLKIVNFSIGMYLWTKNNTAAGNSVSGCEIGIMLSGSNATLINNLITNNTRGVFFGFNNADGAIPNDIFLYHNSFEGNKIQLNGCECKDYNITESPHNWDNNGSGNYWSDYNGTDANGDGIGDIPYIIDELNRDRYPLMQSPIKQVISPPNFQVQPVGVVLAFVALALVAFATMRWLKKRR
ncbi:MAG: hypothetical protein NWE98_07320 [Candidatus Bathyarchaeota archaeon]|nr:hypothetical protein [Candidatus Bathyarchaeota archaeon]